MSTALLVWTGARFAEEPTCCSVEWCSFAVLAAALVLAKPET